MNLSEKIVGNQISAILGEEAYTLLVDMKKGSELEKRLATLEHKIDHIFALLSAGQDT